MKNLITILILLVAAGCGKTEIETKTETGKTEKKPLSPEEKLVGTYEAKDEVVTLKVVLHDNGKFEAYLKGEKDGEGTWKLVGKEVHAVIPNVTLVVWKIEPNGDLTLIARIADNKREEAPSQITLKKVK